MMAHEKFEEKKRRIQNPNFGDVSLYKSEVQHDGLQLPILDIDKRLGTLQPSPSGDIKDRYTTMAFDKVEEEKESSRLPDDSIKDSQIISLIEEAIITDDVNKFRQIGLTHSQIIEFVYQVSGPKSMAYTERSLQRGERKDDSEFFCLNYSIIMLCCQYNSPKIMEYIYDTVVVNAKDKEKTKKRLLVN